MKPLRTLVLALAAALALLVIGAVGYEHSVSSRMDRLLASKGLPANARRLPADPSLLSRLEELGRQLDSAVGAPGDTLPDGGVPGAPWQWKPEQAASLDALVVDAERVLAELEAFLASPEVQVILESSNSFIGREAVAPKLMRLRHWTNVLSGCALASARRGETEVAAKYLRNACELTRLVDDRSTIGIMICQGVLSITFDAASRIITQFPGSAASVRASIDPFLKDHAKEGEAKRAFLSELRQFFEQVREARSSTTFSKRIAAARDISPLLESMELLARHDFDPPPSDPHHQLDSQIGILASLVKSEEEFRRRTTLLRIALALCVTRERTGDWPDDLQQLAPLLGRIVPLDPNLDQPWSYEVQSEKLVLTLADPIRTPKVDTASPYLLCEFRWQMREER